MSPICFIHYNIRADILGFKCSRIYTFIHCFVYKEKSVTFLLILWLTRLRHKCNGVRCFYVDEICWNEGPKGAGQSVMVKAFTVTKITHFYLILKFHHCQCVC